MSKKCFLDHARRDGLAPLTVPNFLSELPRFPQKPRKFSAVVDLDLPTPITLKVLHEGRRVDTGRSSTGLGTQLRLLSRGLFSIQNVSVAEYGRRIEHNTIDNLRK
ncbi:hypothetical protein V6N13_031659 [Hibiscus sabdariffa]|uniref:Uncharacterized protein n=1 Tax=Hibiscus sabdariffa TaxID=183260 RepID=A0ABR2CLG7_9ROSI